MKKRNKKGFISLRKVKWVAPDGRIYFYWENRKTGAKYTHTRNGYTEPFVFNS